MGCDFSFPNFRTHRQDRVLMKANALIRKSMKSADLMELWAQEMDHLSPYRGSLRGTWGGGQCFFCGDS
jgi:hypothetical protein